MFSTGYTEIVQCRVTNGKHINYCYLVINSLSGNCVAIDPAWDRKIIEDNLLRHRVKLSGILITHNHKDHIDLASTLAQDHNCKIYISETEYNYYDMELDPVVLLSDGVTFKLGDITIHPIVTPGHTSGSTCYLINNDLFTGDTLFSEGTGICFKKGGNPVQMYHSIQKLKKLIPDNTIIYPGHKYKIDIGMRFSEIKPYNIYLQLEDMDQFVEFRKRGDQKTYTST